MFADGIPGVVSFADQPRASLLNPVGIPAFPSSQGSIVPRLHQFSPGVLRLDSALAGWMWLDTCGAELVSSSRPINQLTNIRPQGSPSRAGARRSGLSSSRATLAPFEFFAVKKNCNGILSGLIFFAAGIPGVVSFADQPRARFQNPVGIPAFPRACYSLWFD